MERDRGVTSGRPRSSRIRWASLRALVPIAVVSALVGGACGSSSTHGSTAPASGKSTITLGAIIEETGSLTSDTTAVAAPTATKAWEKWVNSHGGIDGHRVNVIIEDDQGNPAVAARIAQSFVDQHVTAVVPYTGTTTYEQILSDNHIPVIGGLVQGGGPKNTPADWFVVGPSFDYALAAFVEPAKKLGFSSYATVVCAEVASCTSTESVLQKGTGQLGLQWKGAVTASASAADYTAQCLAMKQQGATFIAFQLAGPTVARFAQSCQEQGYQPTYFESGGSVDHTTATVPALNGLTVSANTFPWFLTTTPAQREFQAAMKAQDPRIGPGSSDYLPATSLTWTSWKLFQAAAASVLATGAPLNDTNLSGAIRALKDSTLGGLQGPMDYSQHYAAQGPCYYLVTLHHGSWQAALGGAPVCTSPSSPLKF